MSQPVLSEWKITREIEPRLSCIAYAAFLWKASSPVGKLSPAEILRWPTYANTRCQPTLCLIALFFLSYHKFYFKTANKIDCALHFFLKVLFRSKLMTELQQWFLAQLHLLPRCIKKSLSPWPWWRAQDEMCQWNNRVVLYPTSVAEAFLWLSAVFVQAQLQKEEVWLWFSWESPLLR